MPNEEEGLMKRLLVLIGLMILILPTVGGAKEKTHVAVPEDQECSECHVDQTTVWFNGKHGLMNVKCIVCHSSPDKNFTPQPGITRCRGCHGEEVDQVQKKTAKAEKACFPCHDHHSLAVKIAPKSPFHASGGK